MSLDMVDGALARALGQTSRLGAVLDVVADNLARSHLYMVVSGLYTHEDLAHGDGGAWRWGALLGGIVIVEWATFAASHASAMASNIHWKAAREAGEAPLLLRLIFANGFKNPLGVVVIGGVSLLPCWMYIHYHFIHAIQPLAELSALFYAVGAVLLVGRVLGLAAESYVISQHVALLLDMDVIGTQSQAVIDEVSPLHSKSA